MSKQPPSTTFIFAILLAVAVTAVSYQGYGRAFLQSRATIVDPALNGIVTTEQSINLELSEGTSVVGKPSLSLDGRRALFVLSKKGVPTSLGLWEEGIGIIPTVLPEVEIAPGATLSPDGLRIAFLGKNTKSVETLAGSFLHIQEEGLPVRPIVDGVFHGNWQLAFSGDGNRLMLSPTESESKYVGAFGWSPSNASRASRVEGYHGIVVLDFLPRTASGKSHDNSSLAIESPYRLYPLFSTPPGVLETTASGSKVRIITPDDSAKAVKLLQVVTKRNSLFQDLNSDGGADLLVFRQEPELPLWRGYTLGGVDGTMPISASREGMLVTWRLGDPNGIPVPADYNGDGTLDLATFSPNLRGEQNTGYGNWQIFFSKPPSTLRGMQAGGMKRLELLWGSPQALPVPADFDGDGATDIAVFEPEGRRWKILYSAGGFNAAKAALDTPGFGRIIKFGEPGDVPVVADYDGNGEADFALFAENIPPEQRCRWKIRYRGKLREGQRRTEVIEYGERDDIPVPADYDGDQATDIAVFRPKNGTWNIRRKDGTTKTITFSVSDVEREPIHPVADDYDADGKADLAFYVPNGYFKWRILPSRFQDEARFQMPNGLRVITTMNLGGPDYFPSIVWLRNFYRANHLKQINHG